MKLNRKLFGTTRGDIGDIDKSIQADSYKLKN